MEDLLLEAFFIFLLIVVNGYLSGTEIAVVTARKSPIQEKAEKGAINAQILLKLKEEPHRFLATIQVGITLVGVLSSAIGGAVAIEFIKPMLQRIPIRIISVPAEPIAIGIMVVIITYFTLIFGELVPKSIALSYPEKIALSTARSIETFSKLGSIFVKFLTFSTALVLRPFGKEPVTGRTFITEDEVRSLIKEGGRYGVFEPAEEKILQSVFEFTDMSVKEVMVPATQMVAIQIDMKPEEILSIIEQEQFSRYPVFGKELRDIRGILHAKDFLTNFAKFGTVDIRKIIKAPFFIPETMKIGLLLREMQRQRVHIANAVNEYGSVSGLVTIEDLLEEIVGEIRDEHDLERPVVQLPDGSFLIDASITLRDLKEDYRIEVPESPAYETLAGFLMTSLQKMPHPGDLVENEGKRIRIVEMVGKRISRVKLEKMAEPTEENKA